MSAINLCDDEDIETVIEEVMAINEETNFEELSLDDPRLELKTLPSTLEYAFLDRKRAKPMIISSEFDKEQEK